METLIALLLLLLLLVKNTVWQSVVEAVEESRASTPRSPSGQAHDTTNSQASDATHKVPGRAREVGTNQGTLQGTLGTNPTQTRPRMPDLHPNFCTRGTVSLGTLKLVF
jgi:hypothetical protein